MEQNSEIVICPKCRGVGREYMRGKNGDVYVNRGKPVMQLCKTCEGDGRLLRRTTVEYFHITPQVIEEEEKKDGFFSSIFKKK